MREMLSSPQIKALYVMGANPARHLEQYRLRELEFLIVQDIMLTETAQQADVVLPAVTFAEKDGSMTNIDHHVQAIRRALRPLPGAKADWEIILEIGRHLGHAVELCQPTGSAARDRREESILCRPGLGRAGKARSPHAGAGGGACLIFSITSSSPTVIKSAIVIFALVDGLRLYDTDRAARHRKNAGAPGAQPGRAVRPVSTAGRRRQDGL